MRAFFFLVFFDMGSQVIGAAVAILGPREPHFGPSQGHPQESKFVTFEALRPWRVTAEIVR